MKSLEKKHDFKVWPKKTQDARKYLTEMEVERLLKACKIYVRQAERNKLIIWMLFHFGYRVSELIDARWSDVNFRDGYMYVRRLKGSISSDIPIFDKNLQKALKTYHAECKKNDTLTPYIFNTQTGTTLSRKTIHWIVKHTGEAAGFELRIHPHMLRHACGYYFANQGVNTRFIQRILGHAGIENTVRYTDLAPRALESLRR